jgi:hypothetical protein
MYVILQVGLSDRFWREVNALIESETEGIFKPTKNNMKNMQDLSYLITV